MNAAQREAHRQREAEKRKARAATKELRRAQHARGSRPAGKGGWTNDGSSRMGGETIGSGHVAAGYNGNSTSCA